MRIAQNQLYLIIDRDTATGCKRNILNTAKSACSAGIDLIQYRFKNTKTVTAIKEAEKIMKTLQGYKKTRLIINDRIDIAKAIGAGGVHLGGEDMPVNYARKILGKKSIIGKTAHNKKQIIQALSEPVDYLGIGPVFKTGVKPHLQPLGIKKARRLTRGLDKPFFLIGGINAGNLTALKEEGFNNFVIMSAVFKSSNIKKCISQIRKLTSP